MQKKNPWLGLIAYAIATPLPMMAPQARMNSRFGFYGPARYAFSENFPKSRRRGPAKNKIADTFSSVWASRIGVVSPTLRVGAAGFTALPAGRQKGRRLGPEECRCLIRLFKPHIDLAQSRAWRMCFKIRKKEL